MEAGKGILFKSTEYDLVFLAILAGYGPILYIHPFLIGIILLPILQIISGKSISGLFTGTLFHPANLYFLGAILSECSVHPTPGQAPRILIFTHHLLKE